MSSDHSDSQICFITRVNWQVKSFYWLKAWREIKNKVTKRLGNLLILSAQGFLIFTHKMSTTNLDVSIRLYSLYFINSYWQALKIRSTKWRKHNTTFLPGESHGQRSLVGYSPWGRKESDKTERLTHTHKGGRQVLGNVSKLGCCWTHRNWTRCGEKTLWCYIVLGKRDCTWGSV